MDHIVAVIFYRPVGKPIDPHGGILSHRSMPPSASLALKTFFVCSVVMALVAACGSDAGSSFSAGNTSGGTASGGTSSGSLGGGGALPEAGASPTDCKPRTCADQGIECGPAGDGCGGIIADCGKCAPGLRCGGPNAPSKCVAPSTGTGCVPKTCADQGVECGLAGDGCGGILTCPTCASGLQCGSIGHPSKCVAAVPELADGGVCVPKTKADYAADNKSCGVQSDGCGGTIDLGACTAPEFCGGGGPSKCAISGGGACTKKTCADYTGKCGPQPDGCGGVTASCGTCTSPEVCGGGGTPSVCGGGTLGNGDGGSCQPLTTCAASQCGKIADGCGGVLDCGTASCTGGTICGGGGVANQCGAPACVPLTACPPAMNCGSIADGCGGTVRCGPTTCATAGQVCGGGGSPNVCGGGFVVTDGGAPCQPSTDCAGKCGPIADGCGGILACPNNCLSPDICGGGGTANVCGGGNSCVKRTAADCGTLGFNCGFIADGCGGVVQCGATCPNGGICGITSPNVCSSGSTCTNLCLDQPTDCSGPNTPNTTTITGIVYMPNGKLPVPNALVYVPNGTVDPMPTGVDPNVCQNCSAPVSGSPLIQTHADAKGFFTLTNMPYRAAGVPLVIQSGRWRKQITVNPTRCGTVNLSTSYTGACPTVGGTRICQAFTANNTTFGSTQTTTNNIPHYAVTSGEVDSLQCLLRKVGIADSEFTNSSGTGRVHLYHGSGGTTQFDNGTTLTDETLLYGNASSTTTDLTQLLKYDAIVLSCNGTGEDRQGTTTNGWTPHSGLSGYRDEIQSYVDKGGRVFGSHWHHAWLEYGASPWGNTTGATGGVPNGAMATIKHDSDLSDVIGKINTNLTKGGDLADWLIKANTLMSQTVRARGDVSLTNVQHTVDAVDTARVEDLITLTTPISVSGGGTTNTPSVQYFDFNTPVGQATQCGRMVLSDLHVASASSNSASFPTNNCGSSVNLSDQEKVLAFMLFDLTSCVADINTPTCTKKTCADYPAGTCGQQADGCGTLTASCGSCTVPGQSCGGGGVANKCGGPSCTPKGCPAGDDCGSVPDGCGLTVSCGTCGANQSCGGGGVANHCGQASCTPLTCAAQGIDCGQTGDGCGNILPCPACPAGTTCGGGGVPNKCGKPACTPATTCPPGKNCGDAPDGCGGSIHCGDCAPGQQCGGGGAANVCGAASCSPKNCTDLGAECGSVSDGCGGVDTCPVCPNGDFCNGQNLCVAPACTPKTCAQLGVECGPTADTCGGLIPNCGDCPPGEGCGAGGVPGKCGKNPCVPKTCADLGAVCGQVADGCGGLTQSCGDCQGALSCKNGACVQACTPTTCQAAGAQCGAIADGCGSIVDCGQCPPGSGMWVQQPGQPLRNDRREVTRPEPSAPERAAPDRPGTALSC